MFSFKIDLFDWVSFHQKVVRMFCEKKIEKEITQVIE